MNLYTTKQVGEKLGVKDKTIRVWVAAGKIGCHRMPDNSIRISDRQLEYFLQKNEEHPKYGILPAPEK